MEAMCASTSTASSRLWIGILSSFLVQFPIFYLLLSGVGIVGASPCTHKRESAAPIQISAVFCLSPGLDAGASRSLAWWTPRTPTTVAGKPYPKPAGLRATAAARFPQGSCCRSDRCEPTRPMDQDGIHESGTGVVWAAPTWGFPVWRSLLRPRPVCVCVAAMEFCSKATQVTQKRGAKPFLQRLVSTWDGGQIRLPESP